MSGPYFMVSQATPRNRKKRPAKIASKKWLNFISETAAARVRSLKDVGGGNIAGITSPQTGCFSNS